jgi:hypothetical protein
LYQAAQSNMERFVPTTPAQAHLCNESPTVSALAGHAKEAVAFLLGANGMSSSHAAQELAAEHALGSLMAAASDALYPEIMAQVTPLLDRTAHDAVRMPCQPQLC